MRVECDRCLVYAAPIGCGLKLYQDLITVNMKSKIKLILGDCLEEIKNIPEESVDLLVSDPPYNQGYHYSGYHDVLDEQDYRELLYRVLEGKRSCIIHYPEQTIEILAKLNIGKLGEVVSWVYPSNTAKQSRLITWWGCKPDFRKIGQEYRNPADKRIAKRIAEGKKARAYDWWLVNQVKNVGKKDNPHPCPMPIEIIRRILLSTTEIGDTILDPFMGSGTTGVACKELGRNFIGIEIDKNYFEVAKRRIESACAGW